MLTWYCMNEKINMLKIKPMIYYFNGDPSNYCRMLSWLEIYKNRCKASKLKSLYQKLNSIKIIHVYPIILRKQ